MLFLVLSPQTTPLCNEVFPAFLCFITQEGGLAGQEKAVTALQATERAYQTLLTFSSCSMQGVCTTILQAAHLRLERGFCWRMRKGEEKHVYK